LNYYGLSDNELSRFGSKKVGYIKLIIVGDFSVILAIILAVGTEMKGLKLNPGRSLLDMLHRYLITADQGTTTVGHINGKRY